MTLPQRRRGTRPFRLAAPPPALPRLHPRALRPPPSASSETTRFRTIDSDLFAEACSQVVYEARRSLLLFFNLQP